MCISQVTPSLSLIKRKTTGKIIIKKKQTDALQSFDSFL